MESTNELVEQLMQEVETSASPLMQVTDSNMPSDLSSLQRRVFTQWQLAAQRIHARRREEENARLVQELDQVKSQLSRQHREFSAQLQQLTMKRNHGLDVTELAQQVRDLVREVERLKAERNDGVTPISLPPMSSTSANKMVGAVLRDYHVKLCRLEEEISNEKLKRATETSRRIEKESECNQCRKQMDDMRAEIVSLQLKLARQEMANGNPTSAPIRSSTCKPRASKQLKLVQDEENCPRGSNNEARLDEEEDEANTTCTQQ